MSKPTIRAVFFDAVGTLIHPSPSAVEVYAATAARHGSRQSPRDVGLNFLQSWGAQEQLDRDNDLLTSDQRERQRWEAIVHQTLDLNNPEPCFAELWDHFSQPTSWRVEEGAESLITALRDRGLIVGMASNFDARLRLVVAGLPELAGVQQLMISSEIGRKKPHAGFFAHLCQAIKIPPQEVLIVGDDEDNDYQGPRAAGLRALIFDPRGSSSGQDRVTRLVEVTQRLG